MSTEPNWYAGEDVNKVRRVDITTPKDVLARLTETQAQLQTAMHLPEAETRGAGDVLRSLIAWLEEPITAAALEGQHVGPYSSPEAETYVFPLSDFPTHESVRAWLVFNGDLEEAQEVDITAEPGRYRVHDHDEDFEECQRTPDPDVLCPRSRVIAGWWVS